MGGEATCCPIQSLFGYHEHVAAFRARIAVLNGFDLAAYDLVNSRLGQENGGIGIYAFTSNLFDRRYETRGRASGQCRLCVWVKAGL
jgi:hypothetical protein